MKRTISGVVASVVATILVVSSATSATAGESHKVRAPEKFCGEICLQTDYYGAGAGAWFVDEDSKLMLVDDSEITLTDLGTQKKTTLATLTGTEYISRAAISSDHSHIVVSTTADKVYVYDTTSGARVTVTGGGTLTNIRSLAVDNTGDMVFVAVGSNPSVIRRYDVNTVVETLSLADFQYGLTAMELSPNQNVLVVGANGNEKTVFTLDPTNIDGGIVNFDDNTDIWSVPSLAVRSNGTIYAANTTDAGAYEPGTVKPRAVKLNSSGATQSTFGLLAEWQVRALSLSDDETFLIAEAKNSEDSPSEERLYFLDSSDLSINDSLVMGTNFPACDSVDIDSTGRYAIASYGRFAFLITLDNSPAVPVATYGGSGSTKWVDWDYVYLNPSAKFTSYQVKFTPFGSRKAKTLTVKNGSHAVIGETAVGSDIVVRAVYKTKGYTTAWQTATPAP